MLERVIVAMAAAACGGSPTGPASTAVRPETSGRVVVVSIDGLMPAAYTDPDAHGLAVPTLRTLVQRGAFARGVDGVFPTVTYPSHTTLVTGVTPRIHGITSNRPIDPLDKNLGGWRWYAEEIAVPTLWQAVEAQQRPAALVYWPVTVGARATFVVPEYWRSGTVDDQRLVRALSTPGLLAKVERVAPELWTHLVPPDIHDEGPFAIAKYLATQERFDLMLVHVFGTDDAQHDHGPWSPEARAAIERADELLGELLAVLERGPEWERTTFVVVSDHGFAPIDREIRLDALFAERGWIALDAEGKTTSARVATIDNGGTAYVYALDPMIAREVRVAVAGLGEPIGRIYDAAELAELGGDRGATFAVAAAPGYAFSAKRTGPVIADKRHHGHHGFPPSDPAMRASFVAVGPRIAPRDLGVIRMIDIAPTLARWLGVELPQAEGKAIE